MASQRVQALRRAALLVASVVAACFCCGKPAFLGPMTTPTLRGSTDAALRTGVAREAMSGEYAGFVPDMQRRTLMNLVCVAATGIPVVVLGGGYLYYFYPPLPSSAGGGVKVGDINGKPILLSDWMKTHKNDDRELVQGLKGAPTYIITTDSGIKDFAIEATCTHLGCVVPWVKGNNKFCCPCHGSQYDANGKVVRGPAPLSLPLAKTSVGADGKMAVAPWIETDFRDSSAPWWAE